MAAGYFRFWLPLVCPLLSDRHIAAALGSGRAIHVASIRAKFLLPAFPHAPAGEKDIAWHRLLGLVEDERLSELLSQAFTQPVPACLITQMREDLGVSSFKSRKPKISAQIEGLIGRVPVQVLAAQWKLPVNTLETYRLLAGIPKPEPRLLATHDPSRVWTPENIELLHTLTNTQLNRTTGISLGTIKRARERFNITGPSTRPYWPIVPDEELAQFTDEELANRHGGPKAEYAAQRLTKALSDTKVAHWIIEHKSLPSGLTGYLGLLPIGRLAKITSLSAYYLNAQREALGIAPHKAYNKELDALLPEHGDAEIAEVFGLPRTTVKSRRKQLALAPASPRAKARKEKGPA